MNDDRNVIMKLTMTLVIVLLMSFTLGGCSSSTFDPVKAQDYQSRDAVYCGGKENIYKYVDLEEYVIVACTDGKALMIEKDKAWWDVL